MYIYIENHYYVTNLPTMTTSIPLTASIRTTAVGIMFALLSVPFFASAATSSQPTCSLTVTTPTEEVVVRGNKKESVAIDSGDSAVLKWESTRATKAIDIEGDSVALSGIATTSPKKTTTHSYTFISGTRKVTCGVTVYIVSGSIKDSSLTTTSPKPTLSGTVTGTKSVQITVYKEGSAKKVYTSKVIKARNDAWKTRISKKLSDGTYNVYVSGAKEIDFNVIATGTLRVGTDTKHPIKNDNTSESTLYVSVVPLLVGGTVHTGASVPVSYLQLENVGKEQTTIKGFWLKQNGSASTKSVIGFTATDDLEIAHGSVGGVEGTTPFNNGRVFVPITMTFAPGQMRLATIKAILTNNISSHVGTQLKIDVESVESNAQEKGTFPIRGTTWTITY